MDPKTFAFTNPILNGDYPDPAVCRVGADFYLTTSTGHQYPGLTIYHSRNLIDWEFAVNPLTDFSGDVWAPDLVFYKGRFYLYFCADGTNWVIYADDVRGPWSRAIDLKVGHIDPGHYGDADGNRWLFLSGCFVVPLTPDGLAVAGEPHQVLVPRPIPDEWDIEGDYSESPKITEHGGWLYMTYADGGTSGPATSHMVVSARARHPLGPWEYSPYYPILRTENKDAHWRSRGHGHLVDDTAGNWWIVYHSYEKGYLCHGRKLLLERVTWTDDGWFHVDEHGNEEGNPVRPAGEGIASPLRLEDDFKTSSCGIWKAWGDRECVRYRTDAGGLVLEGLGKHPGESRPLTMTCGYHSWHADTVVTPENGCEAGLILFYDEGRFNGIGFDGERLTVYRLGHPLTSRRSRADKLYLRMRNHENDVAFYVSEDGRDYRKINFVIDTESQNNNAYGGFRALRPGLFAAKGGQAHFGFFRVTQD